MKTLIIGFTKIKYMPYLSFYTDCVEHSENVDLLYWDRDDTTDITPNNVSSVFKLDYKMSDDLPLVKKLKGFIKFRKFALGILKKKHYDKIILLHSTPAILLSDYILKNYSGKFILDYRDVTYERIGLYKKRVGQLVLNSFATFVSSEGFCEFLPESDKIYISHNLQRSSLAYKGARANTPREQNPLRISFWGLIRQVEINKQIISALKNDNRFQLHYYGREQQQAIDLKSFCESEKVDNVFFHGEYLPEERFDFIPETDIIHNLYEHGRTEGLAMGNKYYDGIVFGIPLMCSVESHMGNRVLTENTGFACNPYSESFKDDILNYYNSINWTDFEKACEEALEKVLEEYDNGNKIIKSFL